METPKLLPPVCVCVCVRVLYCVALMRRRGLDHSELSDKKEAALTATGRQPRGNAYDALAIYALHLWCARPRK